MENTIVTDIIQLQKGMRSPKKDSVNPHFKSKYISLSELITIVIGSIRNLDLDLFVGQQITSDGETDRVITVFSNSLNQRVEYPGARVIVASNTKNDTQAYGSALTYAKRYSLAAALLLDADIDDDGNSNDMDEKKAFGNKLIEAIKFLEKADILVSEEDFRECKTIEDIKFKTNLIYKSVK